MSFFACKPCEIEFPLCTCTFNSCCTVIRYSKVRILTHLQVWKSTTFALFDALKMNQKIVNFAHCEFLFIWICIVNFSNRKNWYSRHIMEKILLFINFPGFFLSIYLRLWIVFLMNVLFFIHFFSHSGKQAKHLSCNLKQVLVQPTMPSTHIFLHLTNSSSVPWALMREQ